jgi:uncharacterized protein with PIN domain
VRHIAITAKGEKAQLNFGDMITYALAASRQEMLAFTGDAFNHTDLEVVRLSRAREA